MNEEIKEHYKALYLKYGEAAETGQYSSRESQYLRFKYLAEISDLKGINILDFGCGTASFYDYLLKINQLPKKYLGIEIVDEFLEHCKNKIPDGSFHKPEEIEFLDYDYGFVSGVFNNLRNNNRNFWKDTVKTIYKYSRNPMYLCLLMIVISSTMFYLNIYSILTPLFFYLWINRFQIKREEIFLTEKFGKEYLSYKNTTRRWI